ncbi:unnamed protein product, partial [Durusdinium trenchii]
EVMEQQTVSVAKAGIVCSLNARTAILASANPADSCYNPKLSVVENIKLPKNLMTRFDLIWLMLDKRHRDNDHRLAMHLLSMYSEGEKKQVEPEVDAETFRRYVSFARQWVFPTISDEAAEVLSASYMDLRNQGSREVITATPRILESLIRISESLAKMELRESVLASDVNEAVRLLKAATYAHCWCQRRQAQAHEGGGGLVARVADGEGRGHERRQCQGGAQREAGRAQGAAAERRRVLFRPAGG